VTTRRGLTLPVAVAAAVLTVVTGCGLMGSSRVADTGVRGNTNAEFAWTEDEPTLVLGPVDADAARASVDGAAAVLEPDRDEDFYITIVATFDTAAEAAAQADEIRSILEESAAWYADPAHADDRAALDDPAAIALMIPPEADAMKRHLLAAGTRGIGWGGAPDTATDAVYTLGPILVVTGLKSEPVPSEVDPPLHPLAHLLAAQGAGVFFEGDRYGQGTVGTDASCHIADRASAEKIRDDLGDAIATSQYNARPPWIGPPLTDAERLARATSRRWSAGIVAAFHDSEIRDLAEQIASSSNEVEREAAMTAFQRKIQERGMANVEGELDPETMALMVDAPLGTDVDAYRAWENRVGERMGRVELHATQFGDIPQPDDYARMPTYGAVRLNGDRLEMSQLMAGRFGAGFPYLAGYLADHGCDDLRARVFDFTP
jgi:hypothetical protein